MAKVLVAEKVMEVALNLLRSKGIEVDYRPTVSREELLEIIGAYDGLIVRSLPIVDEELLEHATNLRVVGRAGNGVDNIDMDAATKRGIIVLNTPDANSVSACELTIGMMINACRNISIANNSLKSGQWGRSRFQGVELRGKTLGIIGLGRIGTLLAQRMAPFGMKMIAYDPYIADGNFTRVNVEKKETLDDLLREADIITLHTPKTEETLGMIGERELNLVKPGVRIINCARGGLVNEEAVYAALKDGRVAAAAFDVLSKEPCTDSPLYELENFTVTPHIGATTAEAQESVGLTIVEEVAAALDGGMVPNAVNLPMISAHDLRSIQPYLALGELLGKLYHQIEKGAVERLQVTYCGTVAGLETEVITLAVLKGLFEPVVKEQVNYVNARLLAESRGVVVSEGKEAVADNYSTLVKVDVFAKDTKFQCAGTIFGTNEPRIVAIEDFRFDIAPAKYMLLTRHQDKPGVVGHCGLIIASQGVNIDTMQLSHNKQGSAMMAMTVDSPLDENAMAAISTVAGLENVYFLRF